MRGKTVLRRANVACRLAPCHYTKGDGMRYVITHRRHAGGTQVTWGADCVRLFDSVIEAVQWICETDPDGRITFPA